MAGRDPTLPVILLADFGPLCLMKGAFYGINNMCFSNVLQIGFFKEEIPWHCRKPLTAM